MDKIKVIGQQVLSGKIYISGSKNSVVSLIPAAILSDRVIIEKIPRISDVDNLEVILDYLGVSYKYDGDSIFIDSTSMVNRDITSLYSSKLRASYYFMGALLGRFGKVRISLPGGCEIGKRAFDFHLKGFLDDCFFFIFCEVEMLTIVIFFQEFIQIFSRGSLRR